MASLQKKFRRHKLIQTRLTNEEFANMTAAVKMAGARSMADHIRAVLMEDYQRRKYLALR